MFKTTEKQALQLLEYFKKFQITDLIGFGQILGVEEKEDFIEYTTEIVAAFWNQNRLRRRQLLKLAKDITVANDCMVPAEHIQEVEPGDTQVENKNLGLLP